MARTWTFIAIVIVAVSTRSFGAPATKPAEPPPTAEDWTFPAGLMRDNGFRGEVPLNAWWAVRKANSDEVSRSRVPQYVYAPREKDNTFWRDVEVPASWQNRRLVLEVGGFTDAGVVKWDGVELAKVPAKAKYREIPIPVERATAGSHRIEIVTGFVGDNIVLRSYPAQPIAISETYITTSFRQKQMNLQVSATAADGTRLRAVATIITGRASEPPLATLSAEGVAGKEGLEVNLAQAWPAAAKTWSRTEPNLYYYSVELLQGGVVVDRSLPRRFGFREVWAEGREILMNGVPIHFMGDNWSQQSGDAAFNRALVRNAKAMGLSATYRWVAEDLIDACDEEGAIIPYFWLGMLALPYEKVALTTRDAGDAGGDQLTLEPTEADKLKASQERIRSWIKRNREHPSIVSWSMPGPWSRVTLNSLQVGICSDPWKFWPGNNDVAKNRARYTVASQTREFIQSIDRHRPITAQNSPDADIEYATRYLCINLDMQEREQFFNQYAVGPSTRAIWSSEHGVPFQGHQFLRKQPLQQPQGDNYPAIHLENAAREFGDEVYLHEPESLLKRWNLMKDEGHRYSPVYQRYIAENVWFVHRGWRTDGVSAMCHWIARDGWKPASAKPTVADRWGLPDESDPRQWGYSRNTAAAGFPSVAKDQILPQGQQYLRAMSPLLAYIGGAALPANKDHLYYADSEITKSLVLINDHDLSAHVKGEWRVVDSAGKVVQRQPVQCTIGAGRRERGLQKFSFRAPAVRERADYVIELELTADQRSAAGALVDRLSITVFPAHQPLSGVDARVWLVGGSEGDRVAEMLRKQLKAASPTTADDLRPSDVLVVARKYLQTSDSLAALRKLRFDEHVRAGLKVLVLEQDTPSILGLRTENVRPRKAFSAAVGHPVLAGLSPSDLTFWSGSSDLQPAAQPITEADRMIFLARIWQVSNENAVASRTLLRPQAGAARALVVSGFDLQETPLLETAVGQGRIIFCQMDVSSRYGRCPAATLLVDNLVRYLSTVKPGEATRGEVQLASGDQVKPRNQLYRAAKPAAADAWGMTAGEFFFRDSIYERNWVTKKQPATSIPVMAASAGDELPQVISRDPATGLYRITLKPDDFSTGWSRQKIAFLYAAMRINQGGTSDVGPSVSFDAGNTPLYPHRWLEGFIHPYTAACW